LGGPSPNLIPEEILEVIRRRSPEDESGGMMQFQIGQLSYLCRYYIVQSPERSPMIALHFESDHFETDRIAPIAAEYALTEREQEALRGIAQGLTTKELANWMRISPNTAKTFVRLIMIKLGVTTRTAILGRVLEQYEPKSARAGAAFGGSGRLGPTR
jgi:DNA-binding CsgD family transcriptional regulator